MLRDPAWQAANDLTRAQLAMLHRLGDQIVLTEDDRRRALDLDDRAWRAWAAFCLGGPLPAEPGLPDMLRRLGEPVFRLAVVAELRLAL